MFFFLMPDLSEISGKMNWNTTVVNILSSCYLETISEYETNHSFNLYNGMKTMPVSSGTIHGVIAYNGKICNWVTKVMKFRTVYSGKTWL